MATNATPKDINDQSRSGGREHDTYEGKGSEGGLAKSLWFSLVLTPRTDSR
jgi:hypothetical protein